MDYQLNYTSEIGEGKFGCNSWDIVASFFRKQTMPTRDMNHLRNGWNSQQIFNHAVDQHFFPIGNLNHHKPPRFGFRMS